MCINKLKKRQIHFWVLSYYKECECLGKYILKNHFILKTFVKENKDKTYVVCTFVHNSLLHYLSKRLFI